jgi:L-cystine transport system permease protein
MVDFFNWERFFTNIPQILPYLSVTFKIVFYATVFGVLLGIVVAVIRIKKIPVLHQLTGIYVSFMRGTPMLVQLLVIFYGLPIFMQQMFNINVNRWDKIIFVYITYMLNQGAFLSEIFRCSILAIPKGQMEAAYSVGLTQFQAFRRIILPQAARVAVPSFGSDFIGLFQNTSLAFLIGVVDIMGRAKTIGTATKHVLEAYIFIAILFIIISLLVKGFFYLLDKKLAYGR